MTRREELAAMTGFNYTPGEIGMELSRAEERNSRVDPLNNRSVTDADRVEAEKRYHLALTWEPPKGHASWCPMQNPPQWRHRAAGSTPMARAQCGCGKSTVARTVRKINEREAGKDLTVAA